MVAERKQMNKLVCERRIDEGLRTFKDGVIGTIRTIDAVGCKRVIEQLKPVKDENDSTMYYQAPKELLEESTEECQENITDDNIGYRIRKLTPRECFRLMAFSDEDFDKAQAAGVSNSQLYKQAGNSIVVDVLYYIFMNLYEAMPYLFEDLKVSSYFSGIGAFERALDKAYETINAGNFTIPQAE